MYASTPRRAGTFLLFLLLLAVSGGGCAAASDPTGEDEAYATASPNDRRIQTSHGYAGASADERTKIDRIASGAPEARRASLADILEAAPARLGDRDKDGRSTLDNLFALVTSPVHPRIAALGSGFTRGALEDAVFADVAHPENIHQGPFNTCQITSLQYALATEQPSEYVRLMRELVSPAGRAAMRGGDSIALYTKYLAPSVSDTRSASEAIFQTAVMDAITGSYDPHEDESKFLLWSYPGNSTRQARRTVERLFGRAYEVEGKHDWQIALQPLSTMDREGAAAFLRGVRTAKEPAIVDLVLDGMSVSHSVVIVRTEGDRVYYRNPWGPQAISDRSGRIEDRTRAIYSMPIEEAATRMQAYLAPRR